MSKFNVVRRCYGCGAILQHTDPSKEGYIEDEALMDTPLDRVLFCDKCYMDSGFSLTPKEPEVSSDFLTMIEDAKASDALIVYVVDSFSFEASFSSKINELIRENRMLVIANKRDLLPKRLNDVSLREYVAHRFRANGLPVHADQVILTSLNGIGNIEDIAKRILTERKCHDVYIIGSVGAGKSLFFSSFLRNFHNGTSRLVTTSNYPGTSMRVMEIPLDNSSYLYDTPGIPVSNSVYGKLEPEALKGISFTGEVKKRQVTLAPGDSMFLGALSVIELIKSDNKKDDFDVYFGPSVSLKKVGTQKDHEKVYERLISKGGYEPKSILIKGIKDLDVFDIDVEEEGERDLGIEGFGWISFKGSHQTFRFYVPKGVSVYSSRSKINANPKK